MRKRQTALEIAEQMKDNANYEYEESLKRAEFARAKYEAMMEIWSRLQTEKDIDDAERLAEEARVAAGQRGDQDPTQPRSPIDPKEASEAYAQRFGARPGHDLAGNPTS